MVPLLGAGTAWSTMWRRRPTRSPAATASRSTSPATRTNVTGQTSRLGAAHPALLTASAGCGTTGVVAPPLLPLSSCFSSCVPDPVHVCPEPVLANHRRMAHFEAHIHSKQRALIRELTPFVKCICYTIVFCTYARTQKCTRRMISHVPKSKLLADCSTDVHLPWVGSNQCNCSHGLPGSAATGADTDASSLFLGRVFPAVLFVPSLSWQSDRDSQENSFN